MNLIQEDNYTVYMHVAPNNKKYIGITSQRPIRRWQHGCGYACNKHFYRAITKYTWENFQHIIIAENLTKDTAKQMEIELISKYRTQDNRFGYNRTQGGDTTSDYTKQRASEVKSREIFQFNLSGEFISSYKSIAEAGKAVGAKKSGNISEVALGKRSFANGYLWSYTKDYVFVPDYLPREHIMDANIKQQKRVKATSLEDCSILIFSSLHDAGKQTGCNFKNISACCHGRKKTIGGYIWSFIDEGDIQCV